MKKKIIFLSLVVAAIAGCKTELTTDVNYSQLAKKEHVLTNAGLLVEVPACNDFQDSRKESQSLVKLKDTIKNVLPDSEYKECYSKNMTSYASFTTPVSVGSLEGEATVKSGTIYIGGSNNIPMYALIPAPLKKAINKAKKDSIAQKSLAFSIVINLKNDTGAPVDVSPVASYFNGFPVVTLHGQPVTMEKEETNQIKLSDVSVDYMLREDSNNITPILLAPTK